MRCPSLREKKNTGADVFCIQCKLYARKTEKNRNEIRAVPASKLCILKPGHLEFEASKKENLRKLKEAIEQGTKGEMNGFVNVVRSWVAEFCTVVAIIITIVIVMIMMIIVILVMMIMIVIVILAMMKEISEGLLVK